MPSQIVAVAGGVLYVSMHGRVNRRFGYGNGKHREGRVYGRPLNQWKGIGKPMVVCLVGVSNRCLQWMGWFLMTCVVGRWLAPHQQYLIIYTEFPWMDAAVRAQSDQLKIVAIFCNTLDFGLRCHSRHPTAKFVPTEKHTELSFALPPLPFEMNDRWVAPYQNALQKVRQLWWLKALLT